MRIKNFYAKFFLCRIKIACKWPLMQIREPLDCEIRMSFHAQQNLREKKNKCIFHCENIDSEIREN
jgi:hypothetical protein